MTEINRYGRLVVTRLPDWHGADLLQRADSPAWRRSARAMKQRVTGTEAVWLSLLDDEWPLVDAAIQRWLAPDNFDARGQQLTRLRTS